MTTWKCDVCGKERPDHLISVFKTDMSDKYDLPKGTMTFNAKFCNDNAECIEQAPHVHKKKFK